MPVNEQQFSLKLQAPKAVGETKDDQTVCPTCFEPPKSMKVLFLGVEECDVLKEERTDMAYRMIYVNDTGEVDIESTIAYWAECSSGHAFLLPSNVDWKINGTT